MTSALKELTVLLEMKTDRQTDRWPALLRSRVEDVLTGAAW